MMIKGLTITPPVLGRISIGRIVERNGKRLPEKDDQFTITTQVQTTDGWVLHPYDEELRKEAGGKLRSIPVKVPFNDPDLNLSASYTAFDRETGRPACVGNGETCRRAGEAGIETLPCPSPEACAFGKRQGCKPYGRLHVLLGDDPFGTFVLRTTSFNSIRTLAARLRYFHAVSGGLLGTLPLELKLRGKSTAQSYRAPIYYVDLTIPTGRSLQEVVAEARSAAQERVSAGLDFVALDQVARAGFACGAFEETSEDVPAVVEEFYPEPEAGTGDEQHRERSDTLVLKDKLAQRVAAEGASASTGSSVIAGSVPA